MRELVLTLAIALSCLLNLAALAAFIAFLNNPNNLLRDSLPHIATFGGLGVGWALVAVKLGENT